MDQRCHTYSKIIKFGGQILNRSMTIIFLSFRSNFTDTDTDFVVM